MIQLTARDGLQAAETPLTLPAFLCFKPGPCRLLAVTAEDYAGFVALVHWIIWPLLLTLLLRNLLHQVKG